ncbi:cell cycle checkpoint protein RAD1 [Trichonephila clavipes]|nr:cell cycle checkpoint protein RAD1 [Trichonephila clavipes]
MVSRVRRQDSDIEQQYVLEAAIDNTRNLALLLKAIHFRDIATVCATSDGLKVTVEDTKSVQANAYIQSSLFHEYKVGDQTVIFKVNLNVLLECLNIFGGRNNPGCISTVKICYSGYGSPLILLLEENGVTTDCKLQTMEPEDILDFEFTPSKVINKIILQSEILKEVWSDLDMNSDVLEILMSPNDPYFQLTTKGSLATTHINFAKDSDMIESFECTDTTKHKSVTIKLWIKVLIPLKTCCVAGKRHIKFIKAQSPHIALLLYKLLEYLRNGHSSLVVKITDLWPECHKLEPSTAEDLWCRGGLKCPPIGVIWKYQISLIKPSLRALALSSKVSIRTDDRGFLCMQYMIKVEGSQCCFVEYLCSPNIIDDGD